MDDVKENEKSSISVTDDASKNESSSDSPKSENGTHADPSGPPGDVTLKLEETAAPPAPAPVTEPSPMSTPAPSQTLHGKDQENELIAVNGLLLVGLVGAMLYVGTVVFAADSLLFFLGIFIYLMVAPPGTYVQGKSKMVSFTKEVACAFALTFVLFLLLKQFMPPDADQAKWLTIVLAVLGIKLVFNPYYNFKNDD